MAAEPPAKPPKEIPDILKEDVEKLHRSVQVLLVAKQILDCPGSDGPGRLHDYGRPCLSMDNGRLGQDTESDRFEVQRW